jgi:hypothetical protein
LPAGWYRSPLALLCDGAIAWFARLHTELTPKPSRESRLAADLHVLGWKAMNSGDEPGRVARSLPTCYILIITG